jgi:hypothetical protein
MMPQDIGFAAAYEAYRQTKYSKSVYNDYEGQRETQREVAVSEGSSLLLSLTPHLVYPPCQSRALVAEHGSRNRPIWLTDGVRRGGGDS